MYKLTNSAMILRDDGACIPPDPANNDYANYLAWAAAGNVVEPIDAPTLDQAKAAQLNVINDACAKLLASIKAGYPGDEVQSWSKQEAEARAYVADNTVETPLLTAMSTARQIGLADLAARVIEKANMFAVTSGQIIGHRQLREDQINAATEPADVLAIVW